MKKIIIWISSIVVVAIIGVLVLLQVAFIKVGSDPDIQVEQNPDRVARGKYLAYHVAACMDCHSSRDWSLFSGPLKEETLGIGGEYFGPEMGFPGEFYSKNITPAHLGKWTDGEIFRAITSGVNREGEALFPVMPYPSYAKMDREDVYSIIAYLRSLMPRESTVPASKPAFPVNLIMKTMPMTFASVQRPDTSDQVAYGGYLVNVASCVDCHSPVKNGQVIAEQAFSGGREFPMPGGMLYSANITPDPATGIGGWTDSLFVNRFKAYEQIEHMPALAEGDVNTIMPWNMYAGMERRDLEAIFAYLKSLAPIHNEVVRFEHSDAKRTYGRQL